MPRLLVVHHTPSPGLQEMFEAAVSGARTDEIEGVEVVVRPALTAAVVDVLEADGFLLGTPANIGYMSGALKHFFDGIYYPCLEATRRRPYGLYVHGNLDTTGAVRAVESIATGMQWRKIRPPVIVTGPPGKQDLEACWELGALLAAEVAGPLASGSMTDIALLAHQEPVFGAAPSDTTVRRTLQLADKRTLDKVARVRAAVRARVWSLIAATRPGSRGWPWRASCWRAGWSSTWTAR
jgi:hypothetical protein